MDIAAILILKDTFRESDIISRIGGDEFAILIIDSAGLDPEFLGARLGNKLAEFNQKGTRPYPLSLSIGLARYRPDLPFSIDQLLAEADRAMYEEKKKKNAPPVQ